MLYDTTVPAAQQFLATNQNVAKPDFREDNAPEWDLQCAQKQYHEFNQQQYGSAHASSTCTDQTQDDKFSNQVRLLTVALVSIGMGGGMGIGGGACCTA